MDIKAGEKPKKKLDKNFIKKIINFFLDILYPKNCLHCFLNLEDETFFCKNCLSFFTLAEINPHLNFSYAFEKVGPVLSILYEIKKIRFSSLYKVLASYIVLQKNNMDWLEIDSISILSFNFFNKDHNFYLAKEVSKILKIKFSFKPKPLEKILIINDFADQKIYKKAYDKFKNNKIFLLGLFAS